MGKVTLIGAGPGNPDLITIRGMEQLKKADVIIYDRLACDELLSFARKDAVLVYVGKKPGAHSMQQEEINRTIITYAGQYEAVVRLKGGDPFVFGRGGEEIQSLIGAGIPFEVVPGVTSAIAVPELAGIPVTHRGVGRSFHVITGHTKDGEETLPDDMETLARLQGTLVFLMGLRNIEKITEELMRYGKSPNTPAAVISNGTTLKERTVRGTLSDIAGRVRNAGLTSPAVIVIGETAKLDFRMQKMGNAEDSDSKLQKMGKTEDSDSKMQRTAEAANPDSKMQKTGEAANPNGNMRFGLIGTSATCREFKGGIKRCGGEAVQLITMQAIRTQAYELLGNAMEKIKDYEWIFFTSKQAVDLFFTFLKEKSVDIRTISGCRFGVIGEGTGRALLAYGIHADFMPKSADSFSFATEFAHTQEACRILLPRAKQGSPQLRDILQKAGFAVCEIPVYDVVGRRMDTFSQIENVKNLVFFSASGVQAFVQELKSGHQTLAKGKCFYCIGHMTAQALTEAGIAEETDQIIISKVHTVEGLIETILNLYSGQCNENSAEMR